MLSSFVTSEQSFKGSTEHLFLALCFYLVRGTLNLYESSKKCFYTLTKYFNIEKCQGLSNEIVCIFEAQMAAKLPEFKVRGPKEMLRLEWTYFSTQKCTCRDAKGNFCQTFNFDLQQFCSPLSYKDAQFFNSKVPYIFECYII